eukprot:INCI16245.1.p1 GENE.INCI16245.1~~INCI16245.1.p1  ORF type:complete len:339 (-),score=47.31 INCI16245.1:740-1756(-)
MLLHAKAPVHATNRENKTAIHIACALERLDVVTLLLVAKARLRHPRDRHGKLPFDYAKASEGADPAFAAAILRAMQRSDDLAVASELQRRQDTFDHVKAQNLAARVIPTLLGPRSDWVEEEERAESRWDKTKMVVTFPTVQELCFGPEAVAESPKESALVVDSIESKPKANSPAEDAGRARSVESKTSKKPMRGKGDGGIRIKPDDALASVLVALWHMTEPVGVAHLKEWQMKRHVITINLRKPSLKEARDFLLKHRGVVNYFHGKPIKASFATYPNLRCQEYDRFAPTGVGTMARVAELLTWREGDAVLVDRAEDGARCLATYVLDFPKHFIAHRSQ